MRQADKDIRGEWTRDRNMKGNRDNNTERKQKAVHAIQRDQRPTSLRRGKNKIKEERDWVRRQTDKNKRVDWNNCVVQIQQFNQLYLKNY